MLACRRRTVEWPFTFAAIKAGKMAARERRPHNTITGDIESARRETLNRGFRIVPGQFVDFGECGLGRIGSGSDPNDGARETEDRSPDTPVCRVDCYTIERTGDSLVFRRIDRLIGFDVCVALAVAIGVENEGRPALRFLFI